MIKERRWRIGPSGGGKSTIDLLSKFYIVDRESYRRCKRYNTSQLRNIIGIVTQESLFHDSIRNNISFGDESIDEEKLLIKVLQRLQIYQ